MKIYIRYYYSGFDCLVVGGRKSRTENGGTFCNCAKYSGLFLFFTFFWPICPPSGHYVLYTSVPPRWLMSVSCGKKTVDSTYQDFHI